MEKNGFVLVAEFLGGAIGFVFGLIAIVFSAVAFAFLGFVTLIVLAIMAFIAKLFGLV